MTRRMPDPLFAAVQSFFGDHLQRTRGASSGTLANYRDALRLFFDYAARTSGVQVDRLRLADLNSTLVVDFLEHLEHERHNSVATRNCRLAALHSFFAHALRRCPDQAEELTRILALPQKRHAPPPPRYLDPPAVQALLRTPNRQTALGRRDYALILFLYNTGARVSEAIAVRVADLLPGPPHAVRLRGKGGKSRISPLWSETVKAVNAQWPPAPLQDPDQPIFRNARGRALSRHGIHHILAIHAAAAHRTDPSTPQKVWPHLMRHSCAVALLQAGVDLTVIRDILGHASVATTGLYATSNLKLKSDALKSFWAAAGLSSPKLPSWRPSAGISEFLRTLSRPL
jgi:integrase/recombinase XerD